MRSVHAVILAAGCGRRLAGVSKGMPKCLLHFDGVSLLARQLNLLAGAGIGHCSVVVGYQATQVEQALDQMRCPAMDTVVTTLFNPEYEKGSALSCLTAASALCAGTTVVLMDADVLCDARMMERLLTSPHDNCLLVDRALPPGDDPVKLAVRDGRPVGFGKQPGADVASNIIGESVGFFRLTPAMARELARCCGRYERAGDTEAPHEHPLRDLMLAQPHVCGYEDITGLPWIEIDFPEDVQRARLDVLPRLRNIAEAS